MSYVNNKFKQSFEVIAQKFFSKLHYGQLSVTFPSGAIMQFYGTELGQKADLKINNYKFITKILKRKSVGFAESYMDGDFSSSNLTNLLVLSLKNENYFLKNLKTNIFFNAYLHRKNVAPKFTSITFFHSSSFILNDRLSMFTPALLTKTSKPAN